MKALTEFLNESIISKSDNPNRDEVIKWITENYKCPGLKISNNPNANGLYEAVATDVYVTNKNITSLTNGMFEWARVKSFNCSDCKYLESLDGSPKKVRLLFDCGFCTSLKSLEGLPQEVESINCRGCNSLISLDGSPAKVYNFFCNNCDNLKSLKGAPKIVLNNFNCSFCDKLTSIDGMPKEIGGNLYFRDPDVRFSSEELRNASNIKGDVVCYEN